MIGTDWDTIFDLIDTEWNAKMGWIDTGSNTKLDANRLKHNI